MKTAAAAAVAIAGVAVLAAEAHGEVAAAGGTGGSWTDKAEEFIGSSVYVPEMNGTAVLDGIETFARGLDPKVVDVAAGIGLTFGFFFAVLGARFARFGALVVGALVGAALGDFIVGRVGTLEPDAALGLIAASAVSFGALALCMLRLAKVLIGISLGLVCVAFLDQTGIAAGIGNDYLIWGLFAVLVIACAIVSYFVFQYAVVIASAAAGGLIWSVSLHHFVPTGIDLRHAVERPSDISCPDEGWQCWVVLGSGVALAGLGTLCGWYRLCIRQKGYEVLRGGGKSVSSPSEASETQKFHPHKVVASDASAFEKPVAGRFMIVPMP